MERDQTTPRYVQQRQENRSKSHTGCSCPTLSRHRHDRVQKKQTLASYPTLNASLALLIQQLPLLHASKAHRNATIAALCFRRDMHPSFRFPRYWPPYTSYLASHPLSLPPQLPTAGHDATIKGTSSASSWPSSTLQTIDAPSALGSNQRHPSGSLAERPPSPNRPPPGQFLRLMPSPPPPPPPACAISSTML
ncbi:hypothetical protein BU23DRAFT_172483 [Bimuria novae-zelandiae CBS 107.79]|uniref:Uncharacterized protein n=1 Tax=Bimuria novae-zelandiae CBS 107.79 TaxID=1447943 RepID=A0A6A5V3E7_9PLEO|nr:hypothetical protein BU23DRAFT_172483 [Bimuria novae-zelandiae CBS 107.79]